MKKYLWNYSKAFEHNSTGEDIELSSFSGDVDLYERTCMKIHCLVSELWGKESEICDTKERLSILVELKSRLESEGCKLK
ncbi:MAG: hypothetical protein FWC02_01365 [Firmicutes bacterium]|nr:hypothetical protein [Bacillota bacterium]